MKLPELAARVAEGQVDELNLLSLEGGIYLLEARLQELAEPVRDEDGKILHLRSVEHARQLLIDVPEVPFHLVHTSVHDEMCGLGNRAEQPLKVAIALRSPLV